MYSDQGDSGPQETSPDASVKSSQAEYLISYSSQETNITETKQTIRRGPPHTIKQMLIKSGFHKQKLTHMMRKENKKNMFPKSKPKQ